MNHQDFIKEQQWVAQLRQGEEQGFEKIYNAYWSRLFSAAYNYTRNRDTAQEIVQELFVSLWLKRSTLPQELDLKSYLLKAIRNKIYDFCDKQVVRQEYAQYMALRSSFSANTTEQQLDFEELNSILTQQVSILPEKTRQVFILSRVNGYSIPEIAAELQLSIKTVEYHLSKALKYLRFQLTELLLLLFFLGIH